MGRNTQSGQVVIELTLLAVLFFGIFMLAVSLAQTAETQHAKYRFQSAGTR